MAELHASQFRDFFQALHGKEPFPWQEALAAQVCGGEWPDVIHLPTASGKTACIDIALFALAVRGKEAPRRIFFVVDRRMVVNEAYLRMVKVRDALKNATSGVLLDTVERLRRLAGGNQTEELDGEDDPLFVSEMRGGTLRDESWLRNPLQPTVVASTVDQVGSRLLFRGYGVRSNSWPLHAGLIGNDALIFLDEAHCSRAFAQTLQRIEKYRGAEWATEPISTPFRFVEMTATPSRQQSPASFFTLTDNDRKVDVLKKRFQAAKPTRLVEARGRKDDTEKLVDELVWQALDLAKTAQAKRVAIFANRVKTAKSVYERLRLRMKGGEASVELAIGRMRAIDRQDLFEHTWIKLKSGRRRSAEDALTVVVSTQCLEVGADMDFDVLVSECASIDALLQRFGRLDRLGDFVRARGAIVIGSWQINPRQPDPVYQEALAKTWDWLRRIGGKSGEVNMGIESRAGEPPTVSEQLDSLGENDLRLVGEDAPVLLPAHVDMLVQTSPVPEPDPLIELFLHGPNRGAPDVHVVWRSDLENAANLEEEIEIVKLCPPSSLEAMPVPISAFRRWFAGEKDINEKESDLEVGTEEGGLTQHRKAKIYVLVWNGDESQRVWDANKIKPGQTLILRASTEGWDQLGYMPKDALIDLGDRAALIARTGVSLRLHPKIMERWPETPMLRPLMDYACRDDAEWDETRILLYAYGAQLATEAQPWPFPFVQKLGELRRLEFDVYPSQRNAHVLRARLPRKGGRQETKQVFLKEHLDAVERVVVGMASGLEENLRNALRNSARFHDYGKVDFRFQAWLRRGDLLATRYLPKPLAKSGNDVLQNQSAVGLPQGFRHELLSLMFAEKAPEIIGEMKDLTLHLIAAHHGWCRPFAPVILDEAAECVTYNGISICKEERRTSAPHGLGSGAPDRFWHLTSKYGWWGLAYLEAMLRLADWRASENEAAEVSD
jgi:CRISPR-associated endonuclease/helicase Cas3